MARRSSENARATLPKTWRQLWRSCHFRTHGGASWEASPLGNERDERLDKLPVVEDEFLTLLDVRDAPLPVDPVHGERLRVGLAPEDIRDAGRGGEVYPNVVDRRVRQVAYPAT